MEDSIISRIPLFEGMSPEEQEELRAMMTQTTLRRGETLFNEGDAGDRLYILLSGKVKLGHTSSDGRESLLAVLGPGEIIGELTLFDPGPRSTTATAVSPASLLYLEHEDLMHVLDTNPTLAKHMLRALAQRLRRTNTALADLVFSDVQLSDLEHHGATTVPDDSESVRQQFTISKRTLADMSMVSGEDALRGISVPVLVTHDSFDEETGLLDRTREVFHLLPDGSLVEMTTAPDGIAGEYTPVDGVPVIDEAVDRALAASGSAHLPALVDVASEWVSRWVPVSR